MPLSLAAQGYFFAKKCSTTSEIGNQNFFKIHFNWGLLFGCGLGGRGVWADAKPGIPSRSTLEQNALRQYANNCAPCH